MPFVCLSQTRELPEDERVELLEALKAKWDVVNSEYQRIAFKNISSSNATAGEIRRSVGNFLCFRLALSTVCSPVLVAIL